MNIKTLDIDNASTEELDLAAAYVLGEMYKRGEETPTCWIVPDPDSDGFELHSVRRPCTNLHHAAEFADAVGLEWDRETNVARYAVALSAHRPPSGEWVFAEGAGNNDALALFKACLKVLQAEARKGGEDAS